jgi:hypothetical protein
VVYGVDGQWLCFGDGISFLSPRELSKSPRRQNGCHYSSAEANSRLVAAIDDVARKLEGVVQDIVGQLTDKLERDQLEKLTAQVKGVHFALEFGDSGMLGPALGRIMEQIEYAKNRIGEGKREWLGPWLMAESIRIVALRQLAQTDKALEMIDSEAQTFRLNILDFAGEYLLGSRNMPWLKISEFVEGRNEDVIGLIAAASHENSEVPKRTRTSPKTQPEDRLAAKAKKEDCPASGVKTVLTASSAWPFPTGTRP